jgi:hypothetical protein
MYSVSEEHVVLIFKLGLFFDPEDEGGIFLRNVSRPSTAYTAIYSRRYNSLSIKMVS